MCIKSLSKVEAQQIPFFISSPVPVPPLTAAGAGGPDQDREPRVPDDPVAGGLRHPHVRPGLQDRCGRADLRPGWGV